MDTQDDKTQNDKEQEIPNSLIKTNTESTWETLGAKKPEENDSNKRTNKGKE